MLTSEQRQQYINQLPPNKQQYYLSQYNYLNSLRQQIDQLKAQISQPQQLNGSYPQQLNGSQPQQLNGSQPI